MQPIDYKTISPTWIVEQVDGDNVLRPCNPYPITNQWGAAQPSEPVDNKRWGNWVRKHGSLSYPTSLPPGTYKAEDLPDAVWQFYENGQWHIEDVEIVELYESFEEYEQEHLPQWQSRLYIPA